MCIRDSYKINVNTGLCVSNLGSSETCSRILKKAIVFSLIFELRRQDFEHWVIAHLRSLNIELWSHVSERNLSLMVWSQNFSPSLPEQRSGNTFSGYRTVNSNHDALLTCLGAMMWHFRLVQHSSATVFSTRSEPPKMLNYSSGVTYLKSDSRHNLQNLCPHEVCQGSLKTALQIGQISRSSGSRIKLAIA